MNMLHIFPDSLSGSFHQETFKLEIWLWSEKIHQSPTNGLWPEYTGQSIHPGKDERVRVATIKTQRPIVKLARSNTELELEPAACSGVLCRSLWSHYLLRCSTCGPLSLSFVSVCPCASAVIVVLQFIVYWLLHLLVIACSLCNYQSILCTAKKELISRVCSVFLDIVKIVNFCHFGTTGLEWETSLKTRTRAFI